MDVQESDEFDYTLSIFLFMGSLICFYLWSYVRESRGYVGEW
jgi:hypothetical protein